MTVEIAGETYEKRDCLPCAGAGITRDATNADKVCAGGTTATPCTRCRGEGFTLHLLRLQMSAAPQSAPEELGDMPDWMC